MTDEAQARSGEAEAGVARLRTGATCRGAGRPRAHVRAQNPAGAVTVYDGSPALILEQLRPQDRFIACELSPMITRALSAASPGKHAATRGSPTASRKRPEIAHTPGRMLVLIDPPFERADDYVRIVETAAAVRTAKPEATLLAWTPLKDLETLDGFVRRLEDAGLDARSARPGSGA